MKSNRVKIAHLAGAAGALVLGVLVWVFPGWQASVILLVWLSVYAVLVGHLAAAEAAKPSPEVMQAIAELKEQQMEIARVVEGLANRL